MLKKLLTFEEARIRAKQQPLDFYERDCRSNVCGLPEDWWGWGKVIDVVLLEKPHTKNMPVYVYKEYYFPAWLFEGEVYEMFVPSFEDAKKIEATYDPEASKNSDCVGIPSNWKGWGSCQRWIEYDAFDNCYLTEDNWWVPYWLVRQ